MCEIQISEAESVRVCVCVCRITHGLSVRNPNNQKQQQHKTNVRNIFAAWTNTITPTTASHQQCEHSTPPTRQGYHHSAKAITQTYLPNWALSSPRRPTNYNNHTQTLITPKTNPCRTNHPRTPEIGCLCSFFSVLNASSHLKSSPTARQPPREHYRALIINHAPKSIYFAITSLNRICTIDRSDETHT